MTLHHALVVFVFLLPGPVLCCPERCNCKWKGGKQTVECPNQGFETIPAGLDPGTQVLEFSGNNVKHLIRDRFELLGLVNLQRIYFSRCNTHKIDDHAFTGLTNLVEMDLSYNKLTEVPAKTFTDYPALMRLSLVGNPIQSLHTGTFRALSFLTTLELSNCAIETVEDGAFAGLSNLGWLKLDGNRINYISGENILPNPIHGIALERNPWQCDCRLLEIHNWILNYKVSHSVEPKCAGPDRLTGETIRDLEVNDLACMPDVSPTTLYLEIAEGKNISLLCRVSAIPEASVSWWFQGRILQNDSTLAPGFHFYYFLEEGHEEKRSELFIFNTNAEDNGTFVCAAENPAGKSLSNYTIRIIVKEEPVVGLIVFPFEYVVAVCAAVTLLCLIVLITLAVLLLRCRKQRRKRKKKDRSKEAATQNRKSVIRNQIGSSPTKANGTVVLDTCQDLVLGVREDGPVSSNAVEQPCGYSGEQNPDLINGTESVAGEEGFVRIPGKVLINQYDPRFLPRAYLQQHPHHNHTADVHLSPGRFLDGEGYPADFGLPKVPLIVAIPEPQMSFYRTLPHKRPAKLSAANPHQRFAREAEFLSQAQYEYNPADVRYTIEGYPCNPPGVFVPNCEAMFMPPPPAAYKTDQWQQFQKKTLPPDVHMRPVAQCSVAAQTNPVSEQCESNGAKFAQHPLRVTHSVLTESPDEGYVGDAVEATDI